MMAPRLLAAFGTDRGRWHTAVQMQQLSGIAPVTEQSGQGRWVHWRLGRPRFLRQASMSLLITPASGAPGPGRLSETTS